MTTVASRIIRSTPHRDARDTWTAIVALLDQGRAGPTRSELDAVAGIAASIITDQVPRDAAIVVTCDGPRTRVYCIYDDDAVDGSNAKEDALGFDPLNGDWRVSLPCHADDLAWVQGALKKHGDRVTARDATNEATDEDRAAEAAVPGELVLDPKGFLGS